MKGLLAKQLSHKVLSRAAEDMYDEYSLKKKERRRNKQTPMRRLRFVCVCVVCAHARVY